MTELLTVAAASAVASCTLTAAHRRDHLHDSDARSDCHPHTVEVVHLGHLAAMVCHDCCSDSGFVPYRDAWKLACAHRHDTELPPVHSAA